MHSRSPVRLLSLAAAAALTGATLAVAPSAHAAPVFTASELDGYSFAHDDSGDCTETETSTPDTANTPVVENGPAVSYTGTGSATIQHDTVAGDTSSVTTNGTVTAKITSVGGNLGTMDIAVKGSGAVTTALATSGCEIHGGVGGMLNYTFVVTQAGWLTVDLDSDPATYTEAYLFQTGSTPYDDAYGSGFKIKSSRTLFLPAGTYTGYLESDITVLTKTAKTFAGEATLHASFAVAGSQTAAPEGKGKKYVTFPTMRNCAAHTLTPTITNKGKRAKKIQTVTFFVNDTKVKKVSTPSKGQAVTLPIADDVDADVRAIVKLDKVKKGVPAKKLEVTTSYVACS